jgi:hypothetical protein
MAVEVERRLGRPALVECMSDPRRLLVVFNRLAADPDRSGGEPLSTWSPALLTALGVAAPPSCSESPQGQRPRAPVEPERNGSLASPWAEPGPRVG